MWIHRLNSTWVFFVVIVYILSSLSSSLSILNKLIYKTEKETEISENNLLFIAFRSVFWIYCSFEQRKTGTKTHLYGIQNNSKRTIRKDINYNLELRIKTFSSISVETSSERCLFIFTSSLNHNLYLFWFWFFFFNLPDQHMLRTMFVVPDNDHFICSHLDRTR